MTAKCVSYLQFVVDLICLGALKCLALQVELFIVVFAGNREGNVREGVVKMECVVVFRVRMVTVHVDKFLSLYSAT